MEREFDEDVLRQKLNRLIFWKQLAFLLSVCQRLLPSFVVFAKESGHPGEDILRLAIKKAWDNLMKSQFSIDMSADADKCEAVAPDTEDYSSLYVSSALDAAIAISALMKAFSNNDTDTIVEATTLIRDSVDMYVQEVEGLNPNDRNLEDKILAHPLMQQELKRQRTDIEFLSKLDDDSLKSMIELEKNWYGDKSSCLGLII